MPDPVQTRKRRCDAESAGTHVTVKEQRQLREQKKRETGVKAGKKVGRKRNGGAKKFRVAKPKKEKKNKWLNEKPVMRPLQTFEFVKIDDVLKVEITVPDWGRYYIPLRFACCKGVCLGVQRFKGRRKETQQPSWRCPSKGCQTFLTCKHLCQDYETKLLGLPLWNHNKDVDTTKKPEKKKTTKANTKKTGKTRIRKSTGVKLRSASLRSKKSSIKKNVK